jgi:hypothetical protein
MGNKLKYCIKRNVLHLPDGVKTGKKGGFSIDKITVSISLCIGAQSVDANVGVDQKIVPDYKGDELSSACPY